MAKTKKATKAKTSKKAVKSVKKGVLHKKVDNRLSIVLIAAAIVIFALAAISMGM